MDLMILEVSSNLDDSKAGQRACLTVMKSMPVVLCRPGAGRRLRESTACGWLVQRPCPVLPPRLGCRSSVTGGTAWDRGWLLPLR